MKRSNLAKKLAVRPKRPEAAAAATAAVLDESIVTKAKELGRIEQNITEAKTERHQQNRMAEGAVLATGEILEKAARHVERATRAVKNVDAKVGKAAAKRAAARKLETEAAKKAAKAKTSLKKAAADEARAKKARKDAEVAAERLQEIRGDVVSATKEYKTLLRKIEAARADFIAREEALEGREMEAKLRDKGYQDARTRLAKYGKRLAWLYTKRGMALPEQVRTLSDLI